jgi:hypothetical protein
MTIHTVMPWNKPLKEVVDDVYVWELRLEHWQ